MSITDIIVELYSSIPYSSLVYIKKGDRTPLKNIFQSMIIMHLSFM